MQQQQEESEDAYLQWVEAAGGNVSLAAHQHATTPKDIEPLRKQIQGAVNRSKSGAAPVPVDQRKKRKHTSAAQQPSDAALQMHSVVVSQALQLLCLSPTDDTKGH